MRRRGFHARARERDGRGSAVRIEITGRPEGFFLITFGLALETAGEWILATETLEVTVARAGRALARLRMRGADELLYPV